MFDLIAGLLILGGNLFNLKQGYPYSRRLQRYRQGFRTIFKVGIGYGSACVLNAFWPSWHPVTLFLLLLFVCATGYDNACFISLLQRSFSVLRMVGKRITSRMEC